MAIQFQLRLTLPSIADGGAIAALRSLTESLETLQMQCRVAFVAALEQLRSAGSIKRFTEVTSRDVWLRSSEFPERPTPSRPPPSLVELTRPGDFEVLFLGYEIAFKHDGPVCPPADLGSYREPPPFIVVEPPWRLELYRASIQALKTQANLVFKLSVRISFPIMGQDALPCQETCSHDFHFVHIGSGQWRLLWECRNCGLVCHCKCFEKAIRTDPFPVNYRGPWPEHLAIPPGNIPFVEGACDLCRGLPSSHQYREPQYAATLFDARYGAYVRKRLIELGAKHPEWQRRGQDEARVENEVRMSLGFPPIGKPGFHETELFRIVRAIFRRDEVIRHSRPDWLDGLEIDVYIPSRLLAIEYQGEQHDEPISAWGGGEALECRQERDIRKERLLSQHGVRLLRFSYRDTITFDAVRARIASMVHPDDR